MHVSSSRISDVLCFSDNQGSFPSLPVGSFPTESDLQGMKLLSGENTSRRRGTCNDSETREFRLPSVSKLKRNARISFARMRNRGFGRPSVTTFDDFTADLYGCEADDELPLLDDVYLNTATTNKSE